MLLSYQWPGNVRELKNVIEWAVIMWDDNELKPAHLGILQKDMINRAADENTDAGTIDYKNFSLPPGTLPLEEYYNNIILKTLEMHKGNKTETARYLGISRRSLYCRLDRLGK